MKNVAYKAVKMEEQVMENDIYFSGGHPPSSPHNILSVHKTEVLFPCVQWSILVSVLKYFEQVYWGNWADDLLALPERAFDKMLHHKVLRELNIH